MRTFPDFLNIKSFKTSNDPTIPIHRHLKDQFYKSILKGFLGEIAWMLSNQNNKNFTWIITNTNPEPKQIFQVLLLGHSKIIFQFDIIWCDFTRSQIISPKKLSNSMIFFSTWSEIQYPSIFYWRCTWLIRIRKEMNNFKQESDVWSFGIAYKH